MQVLCYPIYIGCEQGNKIMYERISDLVGLSLVVAVVAFLACFL